MNPTSPKSSRSPAELITELIAEHPDWRGKILASLRRTILDVSPGITEEWKWGTAAWAANGPICAAAIFKDHVRLTFFKGAAVKDPKHLFNAGLEAKGSRGIDLFQGDKLDAAGVKALVRAAILLNAPKGK